MNTALFAIIILGVVLWVFTCGAALLALKWNLQAPFRRLRAALIASCVALLSAYLGFSRYHFSASQSMNGHTTWRIDSKWFFAAALVLAGVSLAVTLWSGWRTRLQTTT